LNQEGSSVGMPQNCIAQAFMLDILKHSMERLIGKAESLFLGSDRPGLVLAIFARSRLPRKTLIPPPPQAPQEGDLELIPYANVGTCTIIGPRSISKGISRRCLLRGMQIHTQNGATRLHFVYRACAICRISDQGHLQWLINSTGSSLPETKKTQSGSLPEYKKKQSMYEKT
jgi:hypothetical protein